jgi:hypothetical protein
MPFASRFCSYQFQKAVEGLRDRYEQPSPFAIQSTLVKMPNCATMEIDLPDHVDDENEYLTTFIRLVSGLQLLQNLTVRFPAIYDVPLDQAAKVRFSTQVGIHLAEVKLGAWATIMVPGSDAEIIDGEGPNELMSIMSRTWSWEVRFPNDVFREITTTRVTRMEVLRDGLAHIRRAARRARG